MTAGSRRVVAALYGLAAHGIFVVGVFWERVDSISVVGPGAWLFAIGGLLAFVGGLMTLLGRGSTTSEPPSS